MRVGLFPKSYDRAKVRKNFDKWRRVFLLLTQ